MKHRLSVLILLSFVTASCNNDKLDIDVSDVEVSLGFERFEIEMFKGTSPSDMKRINQDLIVKGGELYEFYVYDMLRSGSVFDDSIGDYLWFFVSDSMMGLVNDDLEAQFADFDLIEDQFVDMFKHQKYHLPNAPLPRKIITYNSAFSYGVISTDSVIGIGLEMYLGPENRILKEVRFPLYMKDKMSREYLASDVAHSWIATNVLGDDRGETFLSSMIYYGKLLYILEAMLPTLPKNQLIRYSEAELEYAVVSEYNIWQYLVDMGWIYSIDMKVKLRFFEEAPTTVGIEESPGRIGQFMGWQMVRAFMDANPDVTVEELLNEENESKILKAYKPKEYE